MSRLWIKLFLPNIAASAMFLLPVVPHQQILSPHSTYSHLNPRAVAVTEEECFCAAEAAAEALEALEGSDSAFLSPQPLSGLADFTRLVEQSA